MDHLSSRFLPSNWYSLLLHFFIESLFPFCQSWSHGLWNRYWRRYLLLVGSLHLKGRGLPNWNLSLLLHRLSCGYHKSIHWVRLHLPLYGLGQTLPYLKAGPRFLVVDSYQGLRSLHKDYKASAAFEEEVNNTFATTFIQSFEDCKTRLLHMVPKLKLRHLCPNNNDEEIEVFSSDED